MASAARSKPIADDVLAVLRAATVEGHHVKLNSGTLDRKLYGRVNEVLANLGGKWKGGKVMAHAFDRDPGPLLAGVLGAETVVVPPKNPLNFFATPEPVARMILDAAAIPAKRTPLLRVLEPSAGEGAIVDFVAANRRGVAFTCVEIDPARAAQLRNKGYSVIEGDFLNITGLYGGATPANHEQRTFDYVLMNPPFECPGNATVYVDHVLHAFAFLKPGGRLVAVCPVGFTFNQARKLRTFRAWVEEHGRWDELPAGAFRASGTGTNTCLVVVDKPRPQS